jgi:Uncharacterized protein conserved in bacteria
MADMNFQVFTASLGDYCVLGHVFENIDHGRMGDYYAVFEQNQTLREFAAKYSTPDNRLVGIIFKGESGDNFIAGAIVDGVTEAPDGAVLMHFPASDFLVTTHDFTDTEPECYPYIGMTVGYAHGENAKIPDGYERYTEHNSYMERFNFDHEANKYRTEVWFAIRKAE